jgi:lysozyme family protein
MDEQPMKENFERCFDAVVGHEGGYVDDPHDPGGETIWGITRRDHPGAWAQGRPTIEQAREIYRKQYWAPAGCNELPRGFDLACFDQAVNQGVRPAVMDMQKALGVTIDGFVGPQTVGASASAGREALALYLAERALRYTQTGGFDRYGRGWLKRTYLIAMEVA